MLLGLALLLVLINLLLVLTVQDGERGVIGQAR